MAIMGTETFAIFFGTLRGEIDHKATQKKGLLLRGCCGWEDGGTLAKE